MAHKICDCDTDATLFSFGGNLFFLENQYNAQKHSLLQSIPYNHIYCSLIPHITLAIWGVSNQDWQQAVFRSHILALHSLRIVSL